MSLEDVSEKTDDKVQSLPNSQHRRRWNDNQNDNDNSKVPEEIESKKRDWHKEFPLDKQRENMRGLVTAIMVGVFGFCVLLLVYFGLRFTAIHASNLKEALEGLAAIGNLLGTYVVPIITLVLGFYFASEKKS